MLLDVEVALNNRPLDYVEDDIQLPIRTPSSLLHIQPNALPELEPNHIQDYDFRKCAKYLSKCKDAVWSLILALLTDQFKMPSKTFALSRQMEGECWKNGLRDCHAVKVNFVPLIKLLSDKL